MGMERISAGGGGWDDDGGGGDEQCATQPAPPSSFSLMTGEDNIKLVTAPWRRRWWGGCAERRRAVRAACVAATVLLAVVVLSNYASWGGDHDEMPASLFTTRGSEDATPANFTDDQLLGGLLTAAFSPQSCRSRYEFAGYHKRKLAHKPSSYLIAKLRKHEALQKRCGPGTAPYKKALRQLKSGDGAAADDDDCCYVISVGYDRGLGNRILAIASAFLYAVLTERSLLVAPYYGDVAALFCEPFPGTTWLLPDGRRFPLQHLRDFDGKSKESLGNLLKSNAVSVAGGNGTSSWSGRPPPYVYLHVEGGADFYDKLFYCDEQQSLLRGVPWLLMKTDCYLVPGLFLVPSLRGELDRMFPEKDAVFHHLSRYLLHPANAVWHAITAYHREHLAGAGRLVGIQIRVYQKETPPVSQVVLDQALSCARREKLLPFPTAGTTNTSSDQTVLVTSLNSWYSDMIRDELAGAVGGDVHQPSHEGWQRLGNTAHDMRALSEMYLLSTCDVLLTSGFSTFGYVAQGLAGERPWLMPRRPVWDKEPATEVPEPPCARAASPEPCFHSPSYYDCAARRNYDDIDKAVPYIRRCEDVSWGIQLVNGSSQSKW